MIKQGWHFCVLAVAVLSGTANACPMDARSAASLIAGIKSKDVTEAKPSAWLYPGQIDWDEKFVGGPRILGLQPTRFQVSYYAPTANRTKAVISSMTFWFGSPSAIGGATREFRRQFPQSANHIRNDCSSERGCELLFRDAAPQALDRGDLFNGYDGKELQMTCRFARPQG